MSTYNIYLESFRSVKKADIKLDGITVLAGPNSSGKSTISKFFYYFMRSVFQFSELKNSDFMQFLQQINKSIERIVAVSGMFDDDEISNELLSAYKSLTNILTKKTEEEINNIDKEIDAFQDDIRKIFRFLEEKQQLNFLEDLLSILSREDKAVLKKYTYMSYVNDIVQLFGKVIKEKNEKRKELLEKRPEKAILSTVNESLHFVGSGNYIYDIQKNKISLKRNEKLEDIQKCNIIYIVPTQDFKSIREMSGYITRKYTSFYDSAISSLFASNKFLNGDIKSQNGVLQYIQNANSYPLEDCASGINSVAQLFLVYNEGYIGKDDIVIIDEPEVHLHPAWIVEYARIIVELRKETEALFLIASHSPQFVAAIKDVSEAKQYNITNEVSFYLSEKVENNTYEFKYQGQSIEDIYASFNEFMDRIVEYVDDEE